MARLRPHLFCAFGICALATALFLQAGPASAQLGKKKNLFMKGLMGAGLLKLLKPKKGVLPIPLPLPVPLPVDWQQQAGLLGKQQHQPAGVQHMSAYSYPQQAIQLAPIDYSEYQSAMQQTYGNGGNYLSSSGNSASYGQQNGGNYGTNGYSNPSDESPDSAGNAYVTGSSYASNDGSGYVSNPNYHAYTMINAGSNNGGGYSNNAAPVNNGYAGNNQDTYERDANGYVPQSAPIVNSNSNNNNNYGGYENNGPSEGGYSSSQNVGVGQNSGYSDNVGQNSGASGYEEVNAPQQSHSQQSQYQQQPPISQPQQLAGNNNNLYMAASSQTYALANHHRQPITFYGSQPLSQPIAQPIANGYSAPLNTGWVAIN